MFKFNTNEEPNQQWKSWAVSTTARCYESASYKHTAKKNHATCERWHHLFNATCEISPPASQPLAYWPHLAPTLNIWNPLFQILDPPLGLWSQSLAMETGQLLRCLAHPNCCRSYLVYQPAGSVCTMPSCWPIKSLQITCSNRGLWYHYRKNQNPNFKHVTVLLIFSDHT